MWSPCGVHLTFDFGIYLSCQRFSDNSTWRRSRRRARLSGIYFALLALQMINASMYLVPNACALAVACSATQLIDWAGVRPLLAIFDVLCTLCLAINAVLLLADHQMVLLEYIVRFPTAC